MPDSSSFAPPDLGPLNVAPRRSPPLHAGAHWASSHWYEAPREGPASPEAYTCTAALSSDRGDVVPREDPALPEVYTYTDAMSYDPGDEVCFYSSSTARAWSLHVYRDGLHPETVHLAADLPGEFVAAPKDAYRRGCGWPVRHQ